MDHAEDHSGKVYFKGYGADGAAELQYYFSYFCRGISFFAEEYQTYYATDREAGRHYAQLSAGGCG